MAGLLLPQVLTNPPLHMRVSAGTEAAFTIVCGVPLAIGVVLSIRQLLKYRRPFALYCMLGGALGAALVEPLLDSNGGVWWPAGGWRAYTVAQIPIPLLVVLVYPWFLGGQAYLAWRAFEQSASRSLLWRYLILFALTDIVLETIGIQLHAYTYYGHQPLDAWGLPLWYVPCNAVGPFLAGAVFYALRPHFGGVRVALLLGVFPMCFALVYAAAGFPVWVALQSNWSTPVATIAALATFYLAYLVVEFVLVSTTGRQDRRPVASGSRLSTTVTGPSPLVTRIGAP